MSGATDAVAPAHASGVTTSTAQRSVPSLRAALNGARAKRRYSDSPPGAAASPGSSPLMTSDYERQMPDYESYVNRVIGT